MICLYGNFFKEGEKISVNANSIELPIASKYIPLKSNLTIHWNLNIPTFESFIANKAESKISKKKLQKEIILVRNALFGLLGVDLNEDILASLKPNISFATFRNSKDGKDDWILILQTNSNEEAILLGENIRGKRIFKDKGISENNNKYGNLNGELIEKYSDKVGGNYSLINQNFVFITSRYEALNEVLEVSENSKLSQMGDEKIEGQIRSLNKGFALIIASPNKINSLLHMPLSSDSITSSPYFISSLMIENHDIKIDSVLILNESKTIEENIEDEVEEVIKVDKKEEFNANQYDKFEDYSFDFKKVNIIDYAFLNRPSSLLGSGNKSQLAQLSQPIIEMLLKDYDSHFPEIILKSNEENIMLIKNNSGWVIIEESKSHQNSNFKNIIESMNYVESQLEIDDKQLTVWSRIVPKSDRETIDIEAKIGLILKEHEDDLNIWGDSILAINELENKQEDVINEYIDRIKSKSSNIGYQSFLLNENISKNLLKNCDPWVFLQSLSGKSFENLIKSIKIDIAKNQSKGIESINIKTNLNLA